jgi:signal peptidase I
MKDGRLFINGTLVDRESAGDYVSRDAYGDLSRSTEYKETLPGGRVHPILELGDQQQYDNTPEFHVPPDHYFMMGDNRDRSLDSRSAVGYVPAENLVGRAEFIFFSTDDSAAIWQVWRWPFAIRFSRIFTAIN